MRFQSLQLVMVLGLASGACTGSAGAGSGASDAPGDAVVDGSQDATQDAADGDLDATDSDLRDATDTPRADATDAGDQTADRVDGQADDTGDSREADGDDDAEVQDADATPPPDCPEHPAPDTSGPWLIVGTGTLDYEPLTPCQEVPLVFGIQGGHHIWGGLQTGGFTPDEYMWMEYSLWFEDREIGSAFYIDELYQVDDRWEYSRVAVEVNPILARDEGLLDEIDGQPVRLDLRLFDEEETYELLDSIWIVPVCCQ